MATLTVLSHNVLWFQGAPFPGDDPGPPDGRVLDALTSFYRARAADVVCLQEIPRAVAFEAIAGRLDDFRGDFLPGCEIPVYGTATLYRAGRIISDARSAPGPVQRAWQVVETAEGIRVANVHLPSSRQLGEDGARDRRREEMAGIIAVAAPDVIVGDLNESPGTGVSALLAERGYLDAAVLGGAADRPTSSSKRGDQIWLRAALGDRFRGYGVANPADMVDPRGDGRRWSDHLPVWMALDVDRQPDAGR